MQANIIVKGIVALLIMIGLVVVLKSCGGNSDEAAPPTPGGHALSAAELAALGIEDDSPENTVATLVSRVRQLKEHIETLEVDNTQLKDDNQTLASMEDNITSKLTMALSTTEQDIERRNRQALKAQDSKINGLLATLKTAAGGGDRQRAQGSGQARNGVLSGDTFWVSPLEEVSGGGAETPWGKLGDRLKGVAPNGSKAASPKGSGGGKLTAQNVLEPPIPYYTIAKNSTLVDTTAMTALIGRVPVGDNVTDPYFFKVIIGRDNLIANGHELPEVSYAIASGEAYGDWTLSCVRGTVFSMTFVFEDGTIRTVPKPADIYSNAAKTEKVEIGELSDRYGNPCVPGKKISNAPKYLAQRFGATAVEAAALAAASSQTTQFDTIGGGGFGSGTVVDGSKSKFIRDQTIAGGAQETADWVRERQALEFDAVLVDAGQLVALHINEQIEIDYDPKGRKTDYGMLSLGENYRELD